METKMLCQVIGFGPSVTIVIVALIVALLIPYISAEKGEKQ